MELEPLVAFCQASISMAALEETSDFDIVTKKTIDKINRLEKTHPGAIEALKSGQVVNIVKYLHLTTSSMTSAEKQKLGVDIVYRDIGTQFVEAEVDFYFVRRTDTILDILDVSFSADRLDDYFGFIYSSLHESSVSNSRSLLKSENLSRYADEAVNTFTWTFFGLGDPGLGIVEKSINGLQSLFEDKPMPDVLANFAHMLLHAQFCAEVGEVQDARELANTLSSMIAQESSKATNSASSSKKLKKLAIMTSALSFVNEILGEDEEFLPDEAPNLKNVRLSDAVAMGEVLEFRMEQVCDSNVWDESNWKIVHQDPSPGAPLGKRRKIRYKVSKI
jgi:hypothetical protein